MREGERDHLEDLGVYKDNIKTDLKEIGWWTRIGLICLIIGEGGGVLLNAVVNIKVT
jgi:hypothetical protein